MMLNCRGRMLDLSRPKIMGILNVTPDSFYDGGNYIDEEKIQEQVTKMINDGVDIIDIGGMSSRPGAVMITHSEEINRIKPALNFISSTYPQVLISLDTIHSVTAEFGLENGVHIINDISAFNIDNRLLEVLADFNPAYVLMHMQGTPADMQHSPLDADVIHEISTFFKKKLKTLYGHNIHEILIDPGFGFGKSLKANYKVLKDLTSFQFFGHPILCGLSRKSMFYKLLEIQPEETLPATFAANVLALINGAKILRVHDVKAGKQAIKIYHELYPQYS